MWQNGACREVKSDLRPRLAARIERADTQRADLAGFITAVQAAVDRLDALPDRTGPCDPDCAFLHSDHLHSDHLDTSPADHPDADPAESDHPSSDHDTAGSEPAIGERWREAPVACALDAEVIGDRVAAWRQVVEQAVEHRPVPDGVRLTLPIEHAARAVELAVAEQACCPFFDFQLRLDGAYAQLTVRAPDQGHQMLTDLFTAPLTPS